VAGTVAEAGKEVAGFAPGDEVFGSAWGGFAEYARAPAVEIAHKPPTVSFEAAAALPIAGLTALQGLCDHGQIKAGQTVLINGAAGGIGTFAVQLARAFETHVTGVCSTPNVALVRAIGADEVVDYTQHDFTRAGRQYDLILDNVGNHTLEEYERCLKPEGICVLIATSMTRKAQLEGYQPAEGRRLVTMLAKITTGELTRLAKFVESGQVAPVIDRTYPLSQAAQAMAYLETRHARGKLILTLAEASP
jgi:NADPH:quinone reductase-like Zn-dependent oxidoreductase